jgi:aminoglycoside phosphotransferase (APT) family kinase protein
VDEARLAEYLSSQTGASVGVLNSRRISSGYSRVSYAVETTAGHFLVRVQQGDAGGSSVSDELQLMRWLHETGFPVAIPRWSESTGEVLGRPFLVVDDLGVHRVDERTVGEAAATAFVKTLATVHLLGTPPNLPSVDIDQATHIQIEHWRNVGKSVGGPRVPVLDAAEIWLHQNAPFDKRLALVHGAPRPNRMFVAVGEASALTDWDMAHLGDPAEDWSYSLSMRDMPPASRQLWLNLFAAVADVRMSSQRWAYWDTFNAYKGACISRTCLALFESGEDLSPAMAVAGTAQYHTLLRRLVNIIE